MMYKAGVQYSCKGETITFTRDMHTDDPLTADAISEYNGYQPNAGDIVSGWVTNPSQFDVVEV